MSDDTRTPLQTALDGAGPAAHESALRASILRAAIGLGLYAGAFGATFGAIAGTAGLTLAQTMVLSMVMFTGASQFAFIGVIGTGGTPFAAIPAALLLGVRNAFYGVPVASTVRPRGWKRLLTAHFVIDETTAMTVAQPTPRLRRYAFWTTAGLLCVFWATGTFVGAALGAAIDPTTLGLDAAAPAVFLALLWPQLAGRKAVAVAVLSVLAAVVLIPQAPSGVPVIAAAILAIVAGVMGDPAPASEPAGGPAGEGAA